MSEAQLDTFRRRKVALRCTDDELYAIMRRFRPGDLEPTTTAEQLIDFIAGDRQMSAVDGKRLSQPIYRILSEGADAGILSDDETVINPDTRMKNTLYRLLSSPRPPRVKDNTWKTRALNAEKEIKRLRQDNEELFALLEMATAPEEPAAPLDRVLRLV